MIAIALSNGWLKWYTSHSIIEMFNEPSKIARAIMYKWWFDLSITIDEFLLVPLKDWIYVINSWNLDETITKTYKDILRYFIIEWKIDVKYITSWRIAYNLVSAISIESLLNESSRSFLEYISVLIIEAESSVKYYEITSTKPTNNFLNRETFIFLWLDFWLKKEFDLVVVHALKEWWINEEYIQKLSVWILADLDMQKTYIYLSNNYLLPEEQTSDFKWKRMDFYFNKFTNVFYEPLRRKIITKKSFNKFPMMIGRRKKMVNIFL